MAGKIFINYRRGDDPGNTGRLFDRLQDAFTPDQLFIDVDSIEPGLDFVRVLNERVAECDVVLAVIGKGWVDARDPAGNRRLDDPDDFVRIEIASALNQGKRVIPVLVGEAQMPRPEDLPDAIKPLARRNAVRLTHERFRADMQGLVKALQRGLDEFDGLRRAALDTSRLAQAEEVRKRAAQAAADRAAAHRAAVESASPAALRSFLDRYPKGADAREIRRQLRRLEAPAARQPRPALVAAVALAAILAAVAGLLWIKTNRTPPGSPQIAALPAAPVAQESPPVATPAVGAPAVPSAQSASRTAPESASPPPPSPDVIAWSLVDGTTDDDSLKRFVAEYPDSRFRKAAETQIASLAAEAARVSAANRMATTRSLQIELKRVGCYQGDVTGQFDDATKAAWHSFASLASVAMPDDVSADALKAVRGVGKRVCPLVCPSGQHGEGDLCVANAPPPASAASATEPSRPAPAAKPRPAPAKPHPKCFNFGGNQYCE